VSDTTEQTGLEALGLTQIEAQPLERVLIRQRESSVTTAAWRLELRCDQGAGGIVRIEVSAAEAFYRGDGLFLGWSQERMGQVYDTLTRPTGGGSEFELMQLG
jgi:hypothetical protein